MNKRILEIRDDFLKKSKSALSLESILEFGSSAYSNNFEDIDLVFISKSNIIPIEERMLFLNLIKEFEKKYLDVVFDFGGTGDRKRKAKYSITVVFVSQNWMETLYNPHDLFFMKLLSLNNKIKIHFGNNPFSEKKFV